MTTLFLVIAVSLAVSFLCSILEAVLLSISHSYVALLEDRGDPAGRLLARMRGNIEEPISAILTLNTIAHTVGASVGGALALDVFGSRWIAVFSAALTLAILLFSEIVPKTLGATHWQRLAPATAHVLRWMILAMKPVLVPLSLFNRLITPRNQDPVTVSRAELEILAEIGRREGTIDEAEWQVVSNVMNLDEVRVASVMTRAPRSRGSRWGRPPRRRGTSCLTRATSACRSTPAPSTTSSASSSRATSGAPNARAHASSARSCAPRCSCPRASPSRTSSRRCGRSG
jgi:CBS domain containing-hemolysin-like protein